MNMRKGFLLSLAIYFLSTSVAQAQTHWRLHSLRGAVLGGKKQMRAGQTLPPSISLDSASGILVLKRGDDEWTLVFNSKSKFTLSQVDEVVLRGELHSGSITLKASAKNLAPVVMDFADWQLRKTQGEFKVLLSSVTPGEYSVANRHGPLWLKKEVMGPANEIPEFTQFKIHNGEDVFAFEKIVKDSSQVTALLPTQLPPQSPTNQKSKLKSKSTRGIATVVEKNKKTLCRVPAAEFEQCAWKCFGGDKNNCDTGSAKTHCVRFTCTADGQWKMPTLVPGGECSSREARIEQCQ